MSDKKKKEAKASWSGLRICLDKKKKLKINKMAHNVQIVRCA